MKDSFKKSELLQILQSATSSKQRNRAAKLLKRFDPLPKKELDDDAEPKSMKLKRYDMVQAFVCYRCDKVKQTHVKVHWSTSQGMKVICHSCYLNLSTMKEIESRRRENNSAY